MSRSLDRVSDALRAAGLDLRIVEMSESTRTAAEAAAAAGCEIDQIAKSILFRGETSGELRLFITAGGNRVDPARAASLAGEPLGKADAAMVREVTGFAIGGVAPLGSLVPLRTWIDPRLMDFAHVWAAAGTPNHIFRIAPGDLERVTGAQVAAFVA